MVDDDFATVPSLRGGTMPENWQQLVSNSKEKSIEGFYDVTKMWFEAGVDEESPGNNDVEVGQEVLPTGITNITPQQDEMIDIVGPDIDGTSAIPPVEDLVENSQSTPTINDMNAYENNKSQNPNMRVCFEDSLVIIDEADHTSLGSSMNAFVYFGADSNMRPMINLETTGLRRSPRIAAKKEKTWYKCNLIAKCFCILALAISYN